MFAAVFLALSTAAPDVYQCQVEQVRPFRYGEQLPPTRRKWLVKQSFRFSARGGYLLWRGGHVGLRFELVQQQGESQDLIATRITAGPPSYWIQVLRIQGSDGRTVEGRLSIPFVLLDGDVIHSGHCNVMS